MTRTPHAVRRQWRVAVMAAAAFSSLVPLNVARAQTISTHKDIVYATVGGKSLALDLYMPVGVDRPPLIVWVHGGRGDQDPQMPIDQSHELEGAYEALGLDVYFDVVHGAVHGGQPHFFSAERNARVLAFLRRTIGQ